MVASSSDSSGLQIFRSNYNLAADGAADLDTPANDGVENLLKYAFNMLGAGDGQKNALTSPNRAVLRQGGTAGLPRADRDEFGKLSVSYIRRKASGNSGVIYFTGFSNNMTAWSVNDQATDVVTSVDDAIENVMTTDNHPVESKRFVRVKVTTP